MPPGPWLTPAQVAAEVGIGVQQIHFHVRRGNLRGRRKRRNLVAIARAGAPVHRKHRRARILIARAELDRWRLSRGEVEDLRDLAEKLGQKDGVNTGEMAQRGGRRRSKRF